MKNQHPPVFDLTFLGAVLDLLAPAALFHLLSFLAATGALILRVVHRVFRLSFSLPRRCH